MKSRKVSNAEYYQKNKEKIKEKNRANQRNYQLKRDFGISLEQYNTILEAQNRQCAICGNKENTSDGKSFAVDEAHKYGNQIRALLCNKCNWLLGMCDENTEILENAIVYIRFFNNKFQKEKP